jgi:inner membrane transporter RhtA
VSPEAQGTKKSPGYGSASSGARIGQPVVIPGLSWRLPAESLIVGSSLSVQLGAGLATRLLRSNGWLPVVTLRIVFSALLLLATRPLRLRTFPRAGWISAVLLGINLGVMNTVFYFSLSRIPLAVAVTIEFWGPLAVAVIGSRRVRDFAWVSLAGIGIYILTGGRLVADVALGVAAAFAAGALWAIYIPIGAHVARDWPDGRGLSLAMLVAAVLSLSVAAAAGAIPQALGSPSLILAGFVIALFSSAIPYSLEIAALGRIPAATFGVLTSIDPAVAAVVGFLVLRESLGVAEVAAIGMVVVASAGASLTARSSARTLGELQSA